MQCVGDKLVQICTELINYFASMSQELTNNYAAIAKNIARQVGMR